VFNIWYFRQTGQQYSPNDAAFYFRMVDVDFTPRPVYDAVSDATASLFVAPPGHFEETNPAVAADPDWEGAIAGDASGQGLLQSDVPGASVTFAFQGHSVDLIARREPEGGHLTVTLDGHDVAGLPVDALGRSYLALDAPSVEWQARLRVAAGLSTAQHVLRLTVAENSPAACNVDAFEVNAGQPPAFPLAAVAGLGLALVAAVAGLVWDLRSRRRPKFF
jgi:hypothetical protein